MKPGAVTARRLRESEPGWGRTDPLVDVRAPLFWVSLVVMGLGAAFLQAWMGPMIPGKAGVASLTLVIWTLYALPLVGVVVALDLHEPEPPALLAAAFAWGAFGAVPVAAAANTSIRSILYRRLDDDFVDRWHPALTGPWTEEVLKALGLVILIGLSRRQITTVLDGMVFGAFIGLGFQVAENITMTTERVLDKFGTGRGDNVIDALVWRGLGNGLWSHAVYTAVVGAGVAYALGSGAPRTRRVGAVVLALLAAMTLHFIWNAPWLEPRNELGDAWIYVVKGLPALILVVVLAGVARSREVEWFAPALDGQPDVMTAEATALRTWHGRQAARVAAHTAGGRRGRAAARRLQSAQVRLAVALATERTEADVEAARQRVRDARADLEAACAPG